MAFGPIVLECCLKSELKRWPPQVYAPASEKLYAKWKVTQFSLPLTAQEATESKAYLWSEEGDFPSHPTSALRASFASGLAIDRSGNGGDPLSVFSTPLSYWPKSRWEANQDPMPKVLAGLSILLLYKGTKAVTSMGWLCLGGYETVPFLPRSEPEPFTLALKLIKKL